MLPELDARLPIKDFCHLLQELFRLDNLISLPKSFAGKPVIERE